MTTVSVVIPAFNASRWISQTLDSVLEQEWPALEVIVVDDGSTDDTAAVVAKYGPVRYIRKPNGGEGSARNAGIRAAQGEFLGFVDADDLWLPDKLRRQVELLKDTGLDWAYSDGYAFDSTTGLTLYTFSRIGRQYQGDILRPLLMEDFIPCPAPIIRRTVFEEIGYFDESKSLFMRADWDMWLRIAARYPIALVRRPLVRYRIHSGSGSSIEHPRFAFESRLTVIERAVAREPERLSPLRTRAIARLCAATGKTLAAQGSLAEARAYFGQAMRWRPTLPWIYLYWLSCLLGEPALDSAIALRRRRRRLRGSGY